MFLLSITNKIRKKEAEALKKNAKTAVTEKKETAKPKAQTRRMSYKVEYREKSQKEIEAQGLDASYAQEKSVYFVDLPGYGFAKVSMETKEKWGKMIEKLKDIMQQNDENMRKLSKRSENEKKQLIKEYLKLC